MTSECIFSESAACVQIMGQLHSLGTDVAELKTAQAAMAADIVVIREALAEKRGEARALARVAARRKEIITWAWGGLRSVVARLIGFIV